MDLGGKNILICHTIIHDIMGSTVVALELAQYLNSINANVTVFASFVSDPMLRHFEAHGIRVIDDKTPVSPESFDIVWINSQVLPLSFCDALTTTPAADFPTFIFLHMSALDIAPDEHPYISGFEEHLSSCSLFVSHSTFDNLQAHYKELPPTAMFENPAPLAYLETTHHYTIRESRHFLVVSNHAPSELHHAAALLVDAGHAVTFMGRDQDLYELLQSDHLKGVDAVISIGKTVPYCLVSGIPIYVYDHFGGPGYLTANNWQDSAFRNHCGAGFDKKTAATIARELVVELQATAKFQADLLDTARTRYGLPEALNRIFDSLTPRTIATMPEHMIETLSSAQRFANRYYRRWGEFDRLFADHHQLEARLLATTRDRDFARADANALRMSLSFRLGQLVAKPIFATRARLTRLIKRRTK